MIVIQISDGQNLEVVRIPDAHAPAFRSAVQEHANELGERLAGAHDWNKEDALTRAASAFNAFRGGLNQIIPRGDRDYD